MQQRSRKSSLWSSARGIFASGLVSLCFFASAAKLVLIRSDQAGLPESIQRETWASIDRSRDSLLASLPWRTGAGETPVFYPAAAFAEPSYPAPELKSALAALEGSVSKPWAAPQIRSAAFVLLGAAHSGIPVPASLVNRLSNCRLRDLAPAEQAIALLALQLHGGDRPELWDALAERRPGKNPALADIAAVALGRQARTLLRSRFSPSGMPSPDVLAYSRYLAKELDLGYYADSQNPARPEVLDAESALLIAVLTGSLPRRLLADPSQKLFPYDWRNHLANRLLAMQLCSDSGLYSWPAVRDGCSLLATTEAILTLQLLSNPFPLNNK